MNDLINRLVEAEETAGIITEESVMFMKKLRRRIAATKQIDKALNELEVEVEDIYLIISKNK
jgi:hypothetical protein